MEVLYIYLIGLFLGFIIVGYRNSFDPSGEFVITFFWPIVAVLYFFIGVFWLPWKLGKLLRYRDS